MPSLVSELTSSQRTWLIENFGSVDAGDFNLQTTESDSESHLLTEQASERRVSDAATLTLSNSEERPTVQFSPPEAPHSFFTLPNAPDLQHHQPSPTGVSETGRSAIFRRPGMLDHSTQQHELPPATSSDLTPRPWTPDRSADQYPYAYYHQQHLFHVTPHHQYDASRNFGLLRPSSLRSNGSLLDRFQKRPILPSSTEPEQIPEYPHEGDKLTWQQSYENLKVYKESYGDCDVPQKYKHNVKLGGWVVRAAIHVTCLYMLTCCCQ